ncbi:MAG: phenylalanine--tRNA ligase subunit beta [Nanohaloarchaea archaeon SW_4_43_9]|nr:MAG: phenylalanine--tRNA ligase subunit beta [Nanohaloarchaea archaeon SW_4_43_9]
MSNIKINKKEFTELVGQKFSDQKLDEEASFLGAHWNHVEGDKWDVEVYPNRPDLLSVEGLSRAYRGFFDIDTGLEGYNVNKGDIHVEVDGSVEHVRPHIGCAVVRDLDLSERMINGLIQLQEKMHETMGRRRDKLAIGLHDLSAIEPPFKYKAVEAEEVSFTPLENEKEMQLGEILDEHEKGREYSWILEDEDKYPIIVDSEDQVLSFPPIINNQLTEVRSRTTDIFIDVTGKDKDTVQKALNIIVTALAERNARIDSVKVGDERMPDLSPEEFELNPEYLREVSGLDLSKTEIINRLKKMKFGAKAGNEIKVKVPCYRADIMHQYDLIEDVVIAHRYTNIEPEIPNIDQIGDKQPIEDLSNIVRDSMVGISALEALTYLHENEKNLTSMIQKEDDGNYVKIENPLSEEYSAVRHLMFPSLLQVLKQNRHNSYPQNFFETGDVVEVDDSDVGASEKRKLGYVESGSDIGFTDVRKKLQVLERDLGIELEVEEDDKPFFRAGRSGKLMLDSEKIGFIGEFSDEVLENWELEMETAGFELDLEKIREER